MSDELTGKIAWNEQGLAPAIAQDHEDGQILMVAWMNAEALRLTVEEQHAVYWSRSRQQLWRKGESSGHRQRLHELRLDCDNDVILLTVEQVGGLACHTGRRSCFFQRFNGKEWETVDPVVRDPNDIYGDAAKK